MWFSTADSPRMKIQTCVEMQNMCRSSNMCRNILDYNWKPIVNILIRWKSMIYIWKNKSSCDYKKTISNSASKPASLHCVVTICLWYAKSLSAYVHAVDERNNTCIGICLNLTTYRYIFYTSACTAATTVTDPSTSASTSTKTKLTTATHSELAFGGVFSCSPSSSSPSSSASRYPQSNFEAHTSSDQTDP